MNAREIRQALRSGVHVIAKWPEDSSGCRVSDAREKNGVLEVKLMTGCWVTATGATIYEA